MFLPALTVSRARILCVEFLLLNYKAFISLKYRSIICLWLSRDWQTNRQESKWNRDQLRLAELMSVERSVSSATHTPATPGPRCLARAGATHQRQLLEPENLNCPSSTRETFVSFQNPEGSRVNPHMGFLMTLKA